jgi:Meiotically up-regulated gene 113
LDVKQLRKKFNENKKDIDKVLEQYKGRYTTKVNNTLYQLMVIALEAELQNILYELRFGKLDDAKENVKKLTSKFYLIATDGNQSIAPTIKKFIGQIEFLYLNAVEIEYEYFVQKEKMKEEQRALKEQMKQEALERKILEQQREQIAKEEAKYQNEINTLKIQLESSEAEKQEALFNKIKELEILLSTVEEKKEEITKLQNGKAGYVYVISNLGSFGDNVFKVGMTRRLEPQDRIDELGSASVPFPFDVHSLIFSNDAVSLEGKIHKHIQEKRLNKVNLRKEFFKLSLDEIEEVVNSYEPTAEFKRTMLAEQYRQSLSLTGDFPFNIDNEYDDDMDEFED